MHRPGDLDGFEISLLPELRGADAVLLEGVLFVRPAASAELTLARCVEAARLAVLLRESKEVDALPLRE
jgi:hypothetical protein